MEVVGLHIYLSYIIDTTLGIREKIKKYRHKGHRLWSLRGLGLNLALSATWQLFDFGQFVYPKTQFLHVYEIIIRIPSHQ